jgi:tetratricopeptide (TPR) repeat protein
MCRVILRWFLFTVGLCVSGTRLFSQEPDDAWKNLIMQALNAAGSNDFIHSEQIFRKALSEAEHFGASDPRVGTTLNSLGLVYKAQKRYAEADSTFRRSLAVLEKAYGFQSIDVANVNFNISTVLAEQGKQPESIPFLEKSLATYQRQLGPRSLKAGSVFCMIGDAYRIRKDWVQAEASLKQCAEIRESNGGVFNGELGDALFSLAIVYQNQGKYALADPRYKLAEKIREKTVGIMSPGLADVLEAHAGLLKTMGREVDANRNSALAAAIRRNGQKSP